MPVLTSEQVRGHLNLSAQYDAELQSYIDAAAEMIEQRVGPLTSRTVTSRVAPGWNGFVLPVRPAISLTSVTDAFGNAVDVADLYLDEAAGIVAHIYGARLGSPFYIVTYVAGRATTPAHLLLAVKELVRHLWKTQRGATVGNPGQDLDPLTSFSLPRRVLELIERDESPGIA